MSTFASQARSFRFALALFPALTLPATAFAAGPGNHTHPEIGEPAKATATTRTVRVTMTDNIFEPETIQVKAGEVVRFVVTNAGEFLHEFNIATAAMHAEHQKEMSMMFEHGAMTATGINHDVMHGDHSHMGHSMKHDHANSVLVEPGKTGELVWRFNKTVDLEFACNVPGHYETGMVGKIEFRR